MHRFDSELLTAKDWIDCCLYASHIDWSAFWLNPRVLRGSDFLMRWSQGLWSEKRLAEAVNGTGDYFAIAYGPSGTAPSDDVRQFELYFERLERAGLGRIKRPDLLVFSTKQQEIVETILHNLGGIPELPFTSEENKEMLRLLSHAVCAVECENSLWKATQMPDYGKPLKPQKRLGGKPGLSKTAVLPTVIIKEEDRSALLRWQSQHKIPIHVWHVFYDLAFGLALDRAEELIVEGLIQPTEQVFQAPGGATTKKQLYKFYYHYAYPLGITLGDVKLIAGSITDKNGHILPFVRFEGGQLEFSSEALAVLADLADKAG